MRVSSVAKAVVTTLSKVAMMTYDDPQQLPPEFHEQPLTARMLDDFATCPRKFLLSFFTSRDAERHFRGGSAALHQAVRYALVDCHDLGGPAKAPLQTLLDSFEAHWEGELCADALEEQQLHDQGLRMLQDYHADHVTEAVEVQATDLRLTGKIGAQAFIAVADVVLAGENGGEDYYRFVTSRSPLGSEQLAQDISAQLLWLLMQDQLDEITGKRRLLYYALRQRKSHEVTLTAEQEAYVRHDITSQVARMHRETDFDPRKGKYCRWCRSRARCPAWRR
jgi:CRISPR/Cas system-associated exonuclease Cas4 (RecB family)